MIETYKKLDWSAIRSSMQTFWDKSLPKDSYITPKVPFKHQNGKVVVKMFASELSKNDIYCELINGDGSFYHTSERRLYKLEYNPMNIHKYDTVPKEDSQFYVPISDLIRVDESLSKSATTSFSTKDVNLEYPSILEMDALDLFAIFHKQPISKNPIINNLINKNK